MLWPFSIWAKWAKQAKADAEFNEFRKQAARRTTDLISGGWKLFPYELPPQSEHVEFTHDGRETFVARGDVFAPEFHVGGLWWRPLRDTTDVMPAVIDAARK